MIISRTPFRISFFGGGTDYPTWYRRHGGQVLATTINKYCYISCRPLPPFFEHRHRVVYSKIECVNEVDEIFHPAVREVMRYLNVQRGVTIHHDGDLPARGGAGSSSAFTVGLLHALYALMGRMPSKQALARESIHIEQERLKETVGSQDQVLAAYGGLNHITFLPNDEITVRPLTLSPERLHELNAHLILFFTGIKRTASNIAESYALDLDKKDQLLLRMRDMVEHGVDILRSSDDIRQFGHLLHEAWQAKRCLSDRVSNPAVEEIYEAARAAGALGGKLLGAGGGGFLLLFVPPPHRERVLERFRDLIHVPFRFEYSGSSIIFFEPENDAPEEHSRPAGGITPFRELDPDESHALWTASPES